jgi:predicted dehydrogenase
MTVNIGLIGFGPMGNGNYNNLKQYANVIAAFDPNPKSKEIIQKHGLIAAESLDALLNIPNLDGLLISSPPQYHADQVVAGLEAGKHVFCEVPMAIKAEDIDRIVALEDRYPNLKYQFGENYCFNTPVLYAAKLAENQTLGPAVYAEAEYLHDVTYRWRQDAKGDITTPRVQSWYSLFDPLAYAHSIGPVQFALGGKKNL